MHTVAHPSSADRETHPRPRLLRASWRDLCGQWDFTSESDPLSDGGSAAAGLPATVAFDRRIVVPFPPESVLSGINDTSPHDRLWYRRDITAGDIAAAGGLTDGARLLLHFGAVDYRARVWVGEHFAGSHEGGHTPFTLDITDLVEPDGVTSVLVCADDDASDLEQPRGKQDWQANPHSIWYDRTSGIWQPVWLESVPARWISDLVLEPSVVDASVAVSVELSGGPRAAGELRVDLSLDGVALGRATASVEAGATTATVVCPVAALRNGQSIQDLVWSPGHPRLVDAEVAFSDESGRTDRVLSYTGFRQVGSAGGRFLLNDQPHSVKAVLSQGYWPESHLAAPDADALRREVQLILDLGFTTARVHEKVEDPRFLYWADRLGLMVWAEMPSAYAYSPRAVERTTSEWMDVIRRDRSHPCVVAWVPLNESWGVQLASHSPAQAHFVEAMYRLTKALDPSRIVISNDGWEHATSDLLTVHDYTVNPAAFQHRYADPDALRRDLADVGPAGRRMHLAGFPATASAPVVVSEFGGVTYAPSAEDGATWGYAVVDSPEDFASLVGDLVAAVRDSPLVAGFCYTQLTDTQQEANGLATADRTPKLPLDTLRAIVTGERR